MKKEHLTSLAVLIGIILFNIIFWREKLGLNALIFSSFIILSLWFLNKESFKDPKVQASSIGFLIASICVVWHNSVIANVIYIFSAPILVGLVQRTDFRFLGTAGIQFATNIVTVPRRLLDIISDLPILRGRQGVLKNLRFSLFLILILPIFYAIYYGANPKFAALANDFWGKIFSWFSIDWNFGRVAFFIFSLFVVGAIFWKSNLIKLVEKYIETPDSLDENAYAKSDNDSGEPTLINFSTTDKYRNSLLLLIALNVLIFINNILDFWYVWLDSSATRTPAELSQYVHEGTFLMIWGILLAILLLFLIFKGSLNFHPNNKILRGWGIAWVAQNAFLAISVGVRNWQYISHCGLAYKRIGVIIFLLLTLIGLYFLYQKIWHKYSFFYVLRNAAWGFYGVLLLAACINWDVFITNYNIHTPTKLGKIDVDFLLHEVSNKNLPILLDNADLLKQNIPQGLGMTGFDEYLEKKKQSFISEYKGYSWLSYNLADDKVANYLLDKGLYK